MSGRVVNLRTRRKQKARDIKRRQTTETAPGVPRAERVRAEAENRLASERLEGRRLDRDLPDEG